MKKAITIPAASYRYCQHFDELYAAAPNFQQVVGELPPGRGQQLVDGWSRSVLLRWLSTDLYEREGAAQTNFELTLPAADCDLARQLVKDPQVFEVFGLAEEHREADLKAAIVANIERTLLSLGRGVAFLGREYPVEIGGGITDYQIKRLLPTQAQLAKCYADAEAQIAARDAGEGRASARPTSRSRGSATLLWTVGDSFNSKRLHP